MLNVNRLMIEFGNWIVSSLIIHGRKWVRRWRGRCILDSWQSGRLIVHHMPIRVVLGYRQTITVLSCWPVCIWISLRWNWLDLLLSWLQDLIVLFIQVNWREAVVVLMVMVINMW